MWVSMWEMGNVGVKTSIIKLSTYLGAMTHPLRGEFLAVGNASRVVVGVAKP